VRQLYSERKRSLLYVVMVRAQLSVARAEATEGWKSVVPFVRGGRVFMIGTP
jgi:hypothetical protein